MSETLVRFKWPLVAALVAVSAIATIVLVDDIVGDDPEPLTITSGGDVPSDVRVYVAGAVQHPGVYPMSPNARWIDALDVAGGPTAEADLEAVNLSQRVRDEAQILIPRTGAVLAGGESGIAEAAAGLINLNTADSAALDTLPGIGKVRAERIILSRDADGPFAQVEDLVLRDLVPDSVYQEILPLVTIN